MSGAYFGVSLAAPLINPDNPSWQEGAAAEVTPPVTGSPFPPPRPAHRVDPVKYASREARAAWREPSGSCFANPSMLESVAP